MRTLKVIDLKIIPFIMLALLTLVGCGNEGIDLNPNQQEIVFEILSGNWDINEVGSIMVDGQDVSLNYAGFSLSFTDGAYATNAGQKLFSASGTWSWANEEASVINLDDGKVITITTLTTEQFVFSFSFDGEGGVANGVNGISGNYTITVGR